MKVKVRKKPVREAERAENENKTVVITINQKMIDLASAKALSSIRQCRYLNP